MEGVLKSECGMGFLVPLLAWWLRRMCLAQPNHVRVRLFLSRTWLQRSSSHWPKLAMDARTEPLFSSGAAHTTFCSTWFTPPSICMYKSNQIPNVFYTMEYIFQTNSTNISPQYKFDAPTKICCGRGRGNHLRQKKKDVGAWVIKTALPVFVHQR